MRMRHLAVALALTACGLAGLPAARAGKPVAQQAPGISKEATTALLDMGKTLRSREYAFQARTIRVYAGRHGRFLHIFHTLDILVRRPDRLRVEVTGDDGATKLFYDGKTVVLYGAEKNRYARVTVPDTIPAMMQKVMGRLRVDFPLADFLAAAPNKAFLTGVTRGWEVGTVAIDGVPARHLFFVQPPGVELELWVDKTERSLPRRLIVTYRKLPGQPRFIAEFSHWDFSVHPDDAAFAFHPPAGAEEVPLRPIGKLSAKPNGAGQ